MENASKALIIAGSILLAILIISLGVMIFKNFGQAAREQANMDDEKVANFNSRIIPYVGDSISGSQVNALIQLVISINLSAQENLDATTVKITFPGNETGISVGDDRVISYGTGTKKVPTGKLYYKVQANYSSTGFINNLIVTSR